jgi:hypothetical protein
LGKPFPSLIKRSAPHWTLGIFHYHESRKESIPFEVISSESRVWSFKFEWFNFKL